MIKSGPFLLFSYPSRLMGEGRVGGLRGYKELRGYRGLRFKRDDKRE